MTSTDEDRVASAPKPKRRKGKMFVPEWIASTMELSPDELGMLLRIVFFYEEHGRIPDQYEMTGVLRVTPEHWRRSSEWVLKVWDRIRVKMYGEQA